MVKKIPCNLPLSKWGGTGHEHRGVHCIDLGRVSLERGKRQNMLQNKQNNSKATVYLFYRLKRNLSIIKFSETTIMPSALSVLLSCLIHWFSSLAGMKMTFPSSQCIVRMGNRETITTSTDYLIHQAATYNNTACCLFQFQLQSTLIIINNKSPYNEFIYDKFMILQDFWTSTSSQNPEKNLYDFHLQASAGKFWQQMNRAHRPPGGVMFGMLQFVIPLAISYFDMEDHGSISIC